MLQAADCIPDQAGLPTLDDVSFSTFSWIDVVVIFSKLLGLDQASDGVLACQSTQSSRRCLLGGGVTALLALTPIGIFRIVCQVPTLLANSLRRVSLDCLPLSVILDGRGVSVRVDGLIGRHAVVPKEILVMGV